jgi:iron complex outermembrane receptor protein
MHKFKLIGRLLLAIIYSKMTTAQIIVVSGTVSASDTKETVPGAMIFTLEKQITVTDLNGVFSFTVNGLPDYIQIRYPSYKTQFFSIADLTKHLKNDTCNLSVMIHPEGALDEVVVSAGRYEQKISELTVSMDVVKPALIQNKNTTQLDQIMNQVPGVVVYDSQISIRGGSGFSYGAGSRVMMLVDEMPLLSADAGDIKWNYIPLENVSQVEVIKGAASTLYGSGALNGVIHFRTNYPKDEPGTMIQTHWGYYDAPSFTYKWWKGMQQQQRSITVTHLEKIGNLDVVVGGHIFGDDGFRYLENENRGRANLNLLYRFKNGLQLGLNSNAMNTRGGLFFIWQNYDSAYIPVGYDIQRYNNYRFNLDPVIYYFKGNHKYSLRSRYFKTNNINDKNQESLAELLYADAQYQFKKNDKFTFTAGYMFTGNRVISDSLYGTHKGNNHAVYYQGDLKLFPKLTFSFGNRFEYFRLDTAVTHGYLFKRQRKVKLPFYPVFRAGLNYQLFEQTFIRVSYGEGYRFPSIAEKFVNTNVSLLRIFPNPSLQPEIGENWEIGIKQGFKLFDLKGYFDLCGFWTKYDNMVEFVFDYYNPDPNLSFIEKLKYYGFQSQNLGKADIKGLEATVSAFGKTGPLEWMWFGGYTYINPIKPDFNPARDTLGLPGLNVLKYRNRHVFKNDIQADFRFISVGFSSRFQSRMENIDRRFIMPLFYELGNGFEQEEAPTILRGFGKNFDRFQRNVWIHDARISLKISKHIRVSYIVNNLFNVEFQARPGDMRPPTTHLFQLLIKTGKV